MANWSTAVTLKLNDVPAVVLAGAATTNRATGPAATIVTTDLGQPHNPPVEDGLALFADALLSAGFTEGEARRMIVDNSRTLAGELR